MSGASLSKPAILIIHGGYFLPAAWSDFQSSLRSAGFESVCPRLPTCGDEARPPTKTIDDDVQAIREAAEDLVAAGKKIIVLAQYILPLPHYSLA